jgi:hypothetical protein
VANYKAGYDFKDPENNFLQTQGSNFGIRSLSILVGNSNNDADRKGLNKDGWSRRGSPPGYRIGKTDNAKRNGIKRLTKKQRKFKAFLQSQFTLTNNL